MIGQDFIKIMGFQKRNAPQMHPVVKCTPNAPQMHPTVLYYILLYLLYNIYISILLGCITSSMASAISIIPWNIKKGYIHPIRGITKKRSQMHPENPRYLEHQGFRSFLAGCIWGAFHVLGGAFGVYLGGILKNKTLKNSHRSDS